VVALTDSEKSVALDYDRMEFTVIREFFEHTDLRTDFVKTQLDGEVREITGLLKFDVFDVVPFQPV